MLRNFLYLDEDQLDQYISQVEDGLRQASSRSQTDSNKREGSIGVKNTHIGGEKGGERQVTDELSDTGASKFERLLQLVAGNEDRFGWIEVLQDADIAAARSGSLIDVACELYESDVTKLTGPRGLLGMMPLMKQMSRLSGAAGDSFQGMPKSDDLDAMAAFGAAMPPAIALGDVVDSDWRIVGTLDASVSDKDWEGDARVVGKVSRVWAKGSWRPLPGLPVVSQMPRDQRRAFEKKGPDAEQEMMWVEGPALQIDILAIYR